ncbi:large conductance mechanosensitive channel protein MscL [Paeniglutamicibacter sp. ABSL32-1]|uniref:large conductance mechanosensitive channel protein MscL n=1 Tax=Paeniglutamicibacter quisquiliarum TaxID=2849498 RepID=UPI001C2D1A2B|nr:large conductance mechanosensitive channel protein MscL [Paeniglutamicibacter quisquiliarum]MBV1779984.1 large conductance mechanosensitive channel protein MscL [Paeniglutamicibacter quisquiliarum]
MLKGFRDFIMQGNVVDLAVAVVIGAAFGAVVKSLVENIIMPLIAALVGSPNFDDFLIVTIGDGVAIKFGVFLTVLVNFILIAAAIYFVVVLPMKHLSEKRQARLGVEEPAEELDPQVALLAEIRDELRSRAL